MTEISDIISACTMYLICNTNFEGVITYVERHSFANNNNTCSIVVKKGGGGYSDTVMIFFAADSECVQTNDHDNYSITTRIVH